MSRRRSQSQSRSRTQSRTAPGADPGAPEAGASKVCRVCGRPFSWRKRWEKNWDEVRTCSDRCRREGIRPRDRALEYHLLELLARRAPDATICPSEAARIVGEDDEELWRPLMEPARRAARRLVAADRVVILQKGRPVDPGAFRGPIRVGRGKAFVAPTPEDCP